MIKAVVIKAGGLPSATAKVMGVPVFRQASAPSAPCLRGRR